LIEKREILDAAARYSLNAHVVEKDYALGWMLAGIYAHPELTDSWIFKGGTCLKKCFFETYRFSEDLDFTLTNPEHLNEDFLKGVFAEIGQWVNDQSGLEIPADKQDFELLQNPRGNLSCQGKISYCGPVSSRPGLPRIKLDLTADERIVLPPVRTSIFHPYSDAPEEGIEVLAYDYVEAFAEKFRALIERTRPRDLYDVVHLYRNSEARPDPAHFRDVLEQKCAFKGIEVPLVTALDAHRDELEAGWIHMLNHQLPSLLPVDAFWGELADIFAWMTGEAVPVALEAMAFGAENEIVREQIVVAAGEGNQSHIEIIRFAAANRLIVELDYVDQSGKRSVRAIEAYSLRRSRAGAILLMAVREEDGQPRSYNLRQIMGVTPTQRVFAPRYPVELSSNESPNIPRLGRSASVGRIARTPLRSGSNRLSGPTYQFRCAVCGKVFSRKTYDASMNTHKGRNGYDCYGTYGIYVGTKH
jgi:predicted nucleotidyltransferase component of viral defense system